MLLPLIVISIFLLFYYFLYKPQLYWKNKNVNQGPVIPIFGDSLKIFLYQESVMDMLQSIYNRHKDSRYCGLYQITTPIFMIRDLDLIKQITVKDFDHFVDHRPFTQSENDPLWGSNIFALNGESWREMRATLSPAFTSSKMRAMFLLMENSAKQYVDFYLEKNLPIIEVDLKDSLTRFANDVIANCAMGLDIDSLKYPNNEFYTRGRNFTNLTSLRINILFFLNIIAPELVKKLKLRMFDKNDTDFFEKIVKDTIELREKQNINRPDVVNLLIEAKKGRLQYEEAINQDNTSFAATEESNYTKSSLKRKIEFSDIEVAAQLFIFYFGSFDTISTIASFMFYEIAVHQEIQEKLTKEIEDTYNSCNGKITYDLLNKMKYLDMVISETLRKNPPAPFMDRLCTKSYTIQPEHPDETPVHLNPGDFIWIPVSAIHNDEQYYTNPSEFNPERFSDENKDNIHPYTYLPFGVGPRNCIGSRFALLEIKILAFHILRKFELTVIKKTTIPMKLAKGMFSPSLEGGFWVGFKQRK